MNGLIYERFGIFNDYDGFVKDQQKLRTNHRTLGQRRNLIIIKEKYKNSELFVFERRC